MSNRPGTIIRWLAIITLVCAYGAGQYLKHGGTTDLIRSHFPGVTLSPVDWSDDAYQLPPASTGTPPDFLVIKSTTGWGGPLLAAVQFSAAGDIREVVVLSHKETPAFLRSLEREGFFQQFIEKKPRDPFQTGRDINAVSGATVSSEAFTRVVSESALDLGRNYLNLEIAPRHTPWQIGANEFILLVLYMIIILSTLRKYVKARKIILVFSIGFLGFHLGAPISVSNMGALLLGYLPSLRTQLFWWLLVPGSLLLILLWGKNLYCVWLCPFGAIQEMITTIAGFRLRVPRVIIRFSEYLVLFLLWTSLMIMFLTTTPALGMFEPFATLFSLKGSGVQWYLVSVSIFASFLIPRFWCRFFCPVGTFFRYAIKLRKKTIQTVRRQGNEKNRQ